MLLINKIFFLCILINFFIFYFFCFNLSYEGKNGVGIIYFAYQSSVHISMSYIFHMTEHSAASYKKYNNISITLFTDQSNYTNSKGLFDKIIYMNKKTIDYIVPGNRNSQWMSRLFYFIKTPYLITLSVDSDTFCCKKIDFELISNKMVSESIDIAFKNHEGCSITNISPDGSTLLYRWSENFKSLHKDWIYEMFESGLGEDDQYPLRTILLRDLKSKNKYKFRLMNQSYGPRFRPMNNYKYSEFFKPFNTYVIKGSVYITHGYFGENIIEKKCSFFNINSNSSRIFVRGKHEEINTENKNFIKLYGVTMVEVYSSEECSNVVIKSYHNNTSCNDKDFDCENSDENMILNITI